MYSHVPALDDDDDDTDSVSSFETCKSNIYEPCQIYQFPSHMLPSLEHRVNEFEVLAPAQKRRRCYARISYDNPARPRVNESRPTKPPLMRHKLQSPPKEAKKAAIVTETTSNISNPAMAYLENKLAQFRTLLHDREAQLALYKQKLEATQRGQECTTAIMKAAQLALEKAVEEHAISEETTATKLKQAEYEVAVRDYWNDSGDVIKELRKESKAQWQRANDAQQRIQRLEEELAHANAELHEARGASEQTSTLQQRLNTSVESARNADQEIQRLRAAVTTSENYAQDIQRQALEHIQALTKNANQQVQRLSELGANVEARANQAEQANRTLQATNEEQAALIRTFQHEGKRLENVAEDHRERASLGATKIGELEQQVSERSNRAQNAEAKVKELEQKIISLETTAAEKGEVAEIGDATEEPEEPSPDDEMEAACAITSLNNRLDRELDEANALLEELALKGMDDLCQDALESLVKTNQVFKQVEEHFEENVSTAVDEVDTILEDAMSDLDMLRFSDIADRPVLVQQVRKVHHARSLIDEITMNAQILRAVYLDDEQITEIKRILKSPRPLPKTAAAAATPSSPPPRARQPTTTTSFSTATTTTSAPLYNPPRPQPSTTQRSLPGFHTAGMHIPGLPTYLPGLPTNPTASPTTGAPTPYNPLFNTRTPSTTSPTAPTPSSLRALIPEYSPHAPSPLRSEYNPHVASPSPESEWDAEQDAEGETDDENVMPEAFAGEHDHGSDYDDDDKVVVPPVPSRPIRQPVSRRRRRRRVLDEDGDEAVIM